MGTSGYLAQQGKAVLVGAKAKMPAKLMAKLLETFKPMYHSIEPHFFSDSSICLNWLSDIGVAKIAPENKGKFVTNRVTLFKKLVGNIPLHHVRSEDNPSDCVSR